MDRDDVCKPDEGYVSEAHLRRFRRLARGMAKLLEEIRRETCPNANLYIEDSGNWILLTGDSHDSSGSRDMIARQDRKVALEVVPHSGGGAW